MYYVVEFGFLDVVKIFVKKCFLFFGLRIVEQVEFEKIRCLLLVELVLVVDNDEMVVYLIRMMWYERQSDIGWKKRVSLDVLLLLFWMECFIFFLVMCFV